MSLAGRPGSRGKRHDLGRFFSSGSTATLYGASSGAGPATRASRRGPPPPVRVDQERERRPVRPGRRLDDPRDEVLPGRRVEVLEALPGGLAVARQVEVAAVVDALELLPAEREAVLDVDRLLRVMGELVGRVLAEAKPLRRHAVALVPGPALRQPLLERGGGLASGRTKYCISICSNSRIRKMKLPGGSRCGTTSRSARSRTGSSCARPAGRS